MPSEKSRQELLRKLSKNLMVSVPVMTVVAVAGVASISQSDFSLIPSAEAMSNKEKGEGESEGEAKGAKGEAEGKAHGEGEAEGKAYGEGEAEGHAEGEGEGHAEGEGEGHAEGEGEGEAEVSAENREAVRRPDNYTPYNGDKKKLAAEGKKLFNDNSLSSNGLACSTCHVNGAAYQDTFANAYPHYVQMGKMDFGMDKVHADEMVQICMVAPMAADPLAWDSKELAALVEYTLVEQKKFQKNQ